LLISLVFVRITMDNPLMGFPFRSVVFSSLGQKLGCFGSKHPLCFRFPAARASQVPPRTPIAFPQHSPSIPLFAAAILQIQLVPLRATLPNPSGQSLLSPIAVFSYSQRQTISHIAPLVPPGLNSASPLLRSTVG